MYVSLPVNSMRAYKSMIVHRSMFAHGRWSCSRQWLARVDDLSVRVGEEAEVVDDALVVIKLLPQLCMYMCLYVQNRLKNCWTDYASWSDACHGQFFLNIFVLKIRKIPCFYILLQNYKPIELKCTNNICAYQGSVLGNFFCGFHCFSICFTTK